jgi:pyruvate dehydrogenase E2 component (dihydrolipoamide acetyltransferase)
MKGVLQMLFADPELVSRDMIEDILRYKRLDGVEAALARIAAALFPGGRQGIALRDRLSGLACPAQVIWGKGDRIVPAGHAEGLPGAVAVYLLEGAGHMAHMEQAGEVNRLIGTLVGD